jgi:hypothetical protein
MVLNLDCTVLLMQEERDYNNLKLSYFCLPFS